MVPGAKQGQPQVAKDRDSGIVSVMAQVMSKALEQRGKNTMDEAAMFAETLLKGLEMSNRTKRKAANKDLEPQGKNLIEENLVVDDGHKVVD